LYKNTQSFLLLILDYDIQSAKILLLLPKYELFSIAPCKVITLNPLCTLFGISIIVGRAITIWEAIQKRSHEPIYKTPTKIEAKRLRATTFAIAMLEER
jgi:hypothetical protein